MSKAIDLTGQRFERLIVIKQAGKNKWGKYLWLCRCNCGQNVTIVGTDLGRNRSKSCGCLNREIITKHGHKRRKKRSEIYTSWCHMKSRCTNPNNKNYRDYGGRGIKVCKRWMKFENFNEDMGESWKPGLTIERKNNNQGYSPENCCWATRKEQARNTRNNHLIEFNGKVRCMLDWSKETGINLSTLWYRFNQGWSIKQTLTQPVELRSYQGKT